MYIMILNTYTCTYVRCIFTHYGSPVMYVCIHVTMISSSVYVHSLSGVGRGASTRHLIAYLKGQLKNSRPYNRMKLMAVGLQVHTM